MGITSFELRTIEWTPSSIALVSLTLVSSLLHAAVAALTDTLAFAVVAIGLLVGFVVFLTTLWQSVLYLVGALYVGITTVVWLLAGMPMTTLGVVDTTIQLTMFGLFIYLFVSEARTVAAAE